MAGSSARTFTIATRPSARACIVAIGAIAIAQHVCLQEPALLEQVRMQDPCFCVILRACKVATSSSKECGNVCCCTFATRTSIGVGARAIASGILPKCECVCKGPRARRTAATIHIRFFSSNLSNF